MRGLLDLLVPPAVAAATEAVALAWRLTPATVQDIILDGIDVAHSQSCGE
jgi:hypothetical protein